MADAKAIIEARRQEIITMISARDKQPGYRQNVEECKTALRELDALLAQLSS